MQTNKSHPLIITGHPSGNSHQRRIQFRRFKRKYEPFGYVCKYHISLKPGEKTKTYQIGKAKYTRFNHLFVAKVTV